VARGGVLDIARAASWAAADAIRELSNAKAAAEDRNMASPIFGGGWNDTASPNSASVMMAII
jgi:hypothetical protein